MCSPPPLGASPDIDSEEDEDVGEWEDWTDLADEDLGGEHILCLFCEVRFASSALVFQHCQSEHAFDFSKLQKDYGLGFYDCLRLINFVRSEVAGNKCWSCGLVHESQGALLKHLNIANHASFFSLANKTASNLEDESEVQKDADRRENGDHYHHTEMLPWQDDKYLTPFLEDDPLLYSFEEDADVDCNEQNLVDREGAMNLLPDDSLEARMLREDDLNGDCQSLLQLSDPMSDFVTDDAAEALGALTISCELEPTSEFAMAGVKEVDGSERLISGNGFGSGHILDGVCKADNGSSSAQRKEATNADLHLVADKRKKNKLKVSFAEVAEKERFSVNQNYFGSYSAYGIHREMLSDKIRTEAYQRAIMENPSLLEGAVVMDLGCGTGILSLFAATAGAKKVIAVEGSKKMASVAQQVAKANGYCSESTEKIEDGKKKGVIHVIQGMIEELDLAMLVEAGGVDVLVSEWMGYCLLFESMLNSVLFARDHWLRPGGAILPDTAEMYVAGFGRGGTGLPFWENVYGFDMQCIGQEVVEDAALSPIVDVVESKDIVTDACLIHVFDLVTMKADDVDFTATFELKPSAGHGHPSGDNFCENVEKKSMLQSNGEVTLTTDRVVWCYGLVVWFDTGFTNRFCRKNPVVLSTSPHSPRTHWSQTLLTFREPISLSFSQNDTDHVAEAEVVGTASSPAMSLKGRISIARSFRHRSIDISLETAAVGAGGAIRTWPVQMFDI